MTIPASANLISATTEHLGQIAYADRAQLLTHLITYLAIISIFMWTSVIATGIMRLGAYRRYRSTRRVQTALRRVYRARTH